MITSLRLERFKRFNELSLPISSLTVLTGTNGAGKTSVIHGPALRPTL
jgi:predicted ATPase